MKLEWTRDATRFLPGVVFEIRSDWGSDTRDFRVRIRAGLADALQSPPDEKAQLLDLAQLPNPSRYAVSISHGPGIGGFAFISRSSPTLQIGFDIEHEARVLPAVIARVSTEKERESAPSPAKLWCAKEAALKALDRGQGLLLSQIQTSLWEGQAGVFTCEASGANGKRAAVLIAREGEWIFSLASKLDP